MREILFKGLLGYVKTLDFTINCNKRIPLVAL